jgi:hypothetical protein
MYVRMRSQDFGSTTDNFKGRVDWEHLYILDWILIPSSRYPGGE